MSTCMTTGIFASTCCPKCRGVSGLDEDCSHVNILGNIIEESVSESGGTTMSITVVVTWTLSSHRYDRPRLPTRVPNRWVILVLIASHSDVRMIAFGSALLQFSAVLQYASGLQTFCQRRFYLLLLVPLQQEQFRRCFLHYAGTRIAGRQRSRFVRSVACKSTT